MHTCTHAHTHTHTSEPPSDQLLIEQSSDQLLIERLSDQLLPNRTTVRSTLLPRRGRQNEGLKPWLQHMDCKPTCAQPGCLPRQISVEWWRDNQPRQSLTLTNIPQLATSSTNGCLILEVAAGQSLTLVCCQCTSFRVSVLVGNKASGTNGNTV